MKKKGGRGCVAVSQLVVVVLFAVFCAILRRFRAIRWSKNAGEAVPLA